MSHAYVLDGYYDNLIPATRRLRIDGRFLAALAGIAVLGTALALGTPRAVEAYNGYQAAKVKAATAAAAWAARTPAEIPSEWRMEPRPLKLDHMFRSGRR